MTDQQPQTADASRFNPATANADAVCETISAHLISATIIGTVKSECGEFAGMRVHHSIRGEFTVWIDRDPEGNGCGALSVG